MNLEFFCASGGLAAGFRRAGITFDIAFDAGAEACESYLANLGQRPIQIDVRDLLRLARAGWRPGPVRLLVADPPCAPWSRAGKRRGTADERDVLRETAELIAILRPQAYLIGNIPGLDDSTHQGVVEQVIGGLGRAGYCTADFARLDAADYGVPQRRVRPFWFGHLAGPCIRWPRPTHGDPAAVLRPHLPGVEPLLPWVTCRAALSHLPLEELGRAVRVSNKPSLHPCSKVDAPANGIPGRSMPGNGGRVLLASSLEAPARTITTSRGDDARVLAWPWDRPATTILTGNADGRLAPPGHGSLFAGERGANAVLLSERAAAILQGFGPGWVFAGKTKTARWSMLGQAVPPAVAEAIGRSVREQLQTTEGP